MLLGQMKVTQLVQFLYSLWVRGKRTSAASSVKLEHPDIRLASRFVASSNNEARPFAVGLATDVGRVRKVNEDAAFVLETRWAPDSVSPPFLLALVADGMGGHMGGEAASQMAIRVACRQLLRDLYLPGLSLPNESGAPLPIQEALETAIFLANEKVHQQIPGSGTTLTIALFLGWQVYLASVGDTRAYVVEAQGLRQLTRDHSLAARLVELGLLDPKELWAHPQRNILYQAVGQGTNLIVDVFSEKLEPGEGVLICSDGLWNQVPVEELKALAHMATSPQEACQAMVEAANQRGGEDNITVLLVYPRCYLPG